MSVSTRHRHETRELVLLDGRRLVKHVVRTVTCDPFDFIVRDLETIGTERRYTLDGEPIDEELARELIERNYWEWFDLQERIDRAVLGGNGPEGNRT